jgi:hypothetical protein
MKNCFLIFYFLFFLSVSTAEHSDYEQNGSRFWKDETPQNNLLLKNIDFSKILVFEGYTEKILTPSKEEIEDARKKGLLREKDEELIKNNKYSFKAIIPTTKIDFQKTLPEPQNELLYKFSNPQWNCGQISWVPYFRDWEKREPREIAGILLFKGKFENTTLGKLYEHNKPGSAKKIEEQMEAFRKAQGITEKDRIFIADTKIQTGTIIDNVNYMQSLPAPHMSHVVTVLGVLVKKNEKGENIPIDLFVLEKQNPGLYPFTISLLSTVRKRAMTGNFDIVYTPIKK